MTKSMVSNIKQTLDENLSKGLQGFLLRSAVFIALLYIALPFLAKITVDLLGGGMNYTINYFYIEFIYLGIIVIFLLYSRHKIMDLKEYSQSWRQTFLFGYIGLIFYALKVFVKYFVNTLFLGNSIYIVVLLEYAFAVVAAAFFALSVFNVVAFKKFYKEITISIVISFCFFSFAMLLRSTWGFFSYVVGTAVMGIFRLTMSNPDLNFNDFSMSVNGFSAAIGAPCSGIESMAMFASIFILLVIYDFNDLNKKKIVPYFMVGIIGMYVMTIIRIYLLFLVGTFNPDLAMSLFHTNLGWVLFVVYILMFLCFIYPTMMQSRIYSSASKKFKNIKK